MSYVPSTDLQRQEMLAALGMSDMRELYRDVPAGMLLERPLDIPQGLSELEVSRAMGDMAKKNTVFSTVLRGAGHMTTIFRVS